MGPGDSDGQTPTVSPVAVPSDTPPDIPRTLRGGVDAEALAQGHAGALVGRSYRWRLYLERPVGEAGAERRVVEATTVSVAAPTTFRSQRSETILDTGFGIRITRAETYADGERAYTRVRNRRLDTVRYEASRVALCAGGEGPTLDAAESAIVRYLSVAESTVTFEQTRTGPRFRVTGRDATHPSLAGVSDYRVEALVTTDGVVREVDATYDRPTENGTESVTAGFAYATIDRTEVSPPSWLGRARAATAGLDLPATVPVGTPTATPGPVAPSGSTTTPTSPIPTGGCGGFDCEPFPGSEAVGAGRCAG
jgi:hypothetical protein